MGKSLRVVIDTNVWLSGIYFGGKPAKVIYLIETQEIVSITSDYILNELKDSMIEDFQTPSFVSTATITYIKSFSEIVYVKGIDFGLRDVADNQVLETAVVGKCNYLITGDKDLLVLGQFGKIKIITAGQFLQEYA